MKTTQRLFGLFIFALSSLLFSSCNGCSEKDDEEQIRSLFAKAVGFAEEHRLGDLMDLVTDDFKSKPGSRDRRETKGILLIAFKRYGNFTIEYPNPTIRLGESRLVATASTPFVIIRSDKEFPDLRDLYDDPDGWLQEVAEVADPYQIKLNLEKDDDTWKVRAATLIGTKSLGGI